ncbi:mitogen-activated protein kinase kinase kinase 19 isoform X2 [Narcine bancroftii]|uniref:mitogen-activated protein kinase kinase kinase 19 isoform X2 n=1 Tax=Narcine bancroftii TaxID=1343680 RepID=UPI003831791D
MEQIKTLKNEVSLAQLSTSIVKSVPVRLLPIEGEHVADKQSDCGISNHTALTSHSKQNSSLSPPESTTRAERQSAHSLAQFNRQKSVSEYTSSSASIKQTSFNEVENPKHTQSHIPLCLEIYPGTCADCVATGSKIKYDDLLLEEIAKNLSVKDVTHKMILKGKEEYTSAGSDKCEELDKSSSTNELINVSSDKDNSVLLDVTLCSEPNLQIYKSLTCTLANMCVNVLSSATIGLNENKSLQNGQKTKISANETLEFEQEQKQIKTPFQRDKPRENETPEEIPLDFANHFGQCITKYTSSVKEEEIVLHKTKCNSVEDDTWAKQAPSNTLLFSKKTLAKIKNASFDVPHNAISSFNILVQKEREMKRKISKINCINQSSNSTPEINISRSKSLKSPPISTQSWLRKSMLMPSTAHFLQCKKTPIFPSLDNFHLHQISSKVQSKIPKGIMKNGKTSNGKSNSYGKRNTNSLNKSTIPQIPGLSSTSDFSALKYSDMFQEIYPIDKGPGIYEMFSSPLYHAMRKSTVCETNHQTVHSVPRRREIINKFSKSNRATEKSNAIKIKNKQNSKQKKMDTHVKKKKKNAEESTFLVKSDKGQENVELISGQDCQYLDSQRVSDHGHLSDDSESNHPLPDNEGHLNGQYLSTIIEDSFQQASVKPVTSEDHDNMHKKSSDAGVEEENVGDDTNYRFRSSVLPKTKYTECSDIDLFEGGRYLNKKDKSLVNESIFAQEHTAVLPNGLNWDIVVNDAELAELCAEDQCNTSRGAKAASHPNSKETDVPIQPLINIWTVENMFPAIQFEGDREHNLEDGQLHCLTSALLLEEKNSYNNMEQMATYAQQTECYGNKDNASENTNGKMINGISIQRTEYTVTKLFKTSSRPSSSLCDTIKSECSYNCEDVIIWTKGNVLGKGAYGTVYCGLTSQGQLIAVKQVILDATNQTVAEKEYQKLEEEIELLKDLKHDNIVHFLGTNLEANVVSIFMEFVPGGSIAGIISSFGPLPEPVFCGYTKQVLKGVVYLHDNKVIHRDIKGNNVMLMPNGVIKLIDFGCAKRMICVNMNDTHGEMLKSMHGTPYWMAPEVINETGHGRKSDIWSIGCTVFEMASGKPPLAHMDKMAAMFYIGAHRGLMPNLPVQFSENAQDFVQICLTRDQYKRPSAKQLLEHAFIIQKQKKQPFQKSKIVAKTESQATIISKSRSLGITEL